MRAAAVFLAMGMSVAWSQEPVTSLATLLAEAEGGNPEIRAALHAWRAATQAPSQVSTLPDPQVVVQQFSVGSPRPYAGFTNSDFAYIGVGISQDIPFPGKLKLRGEIAEREAAASRDRFEAQKRMVREQVKTAYFQLAQSQHVIELLGRYGPLVQQIESVAELRYRAGKGNQQDVLKAQLQRTKLLAEISTRRRDLAASQAQLKQALNRPPNSPDVRAADLVETPFAYQADELLSRVRQANPDLSMRRQAVRERSLQVELARKDFYPDFNVQYTWQHTGPNFRDYYMLSFGAKLPIYHRRKQEPEVTQATEEFKRSQSEYEAMLQRSYFEAQTEILSAQSAAEILKIYREGLVPQSLATFQAGLAAYEANQQDFQTLLSSFLDVLRLDEEYWQALLQHEMALGKIERLTGVAL